jgi:hypothetical protein
MQDPGGWNGYRIKASGFPDNPEKKPAFYDPMIAQGQD